jgi:hypothetical protein
VSLARIRQVPAPAPETAWEWNHRIAIRPDEDGVDDVVVSNVSMFRMERMDSGSFWLCCYFPDDPTGHNRLVFWLNTKRGAFINASVTEQPPNCDAFPYEPGSIGA